MGLLVLSYHKLLLKELEKWYRKNSLDEKKIRHRSELQNQDPRVFVVDEGLDRRMREVAATWQQ